MKFYNECVIHQDVCSDNNNRPKELLDMPNEILINILEHLNVFELSTNIVLCCQRLYSLVVNILNGRLSFNNPHDVSARRVSASHISAGTEAKEHQVNEAIGRILKVKEICSCISYLIFQEDGLMFERYCFYNSSIHFKNSYELLEASDNLEEWEKVSGIGIVCPFPSQNIVQQCIISFVNLKYLYMFGEDSRVHLPDRTVNLPYFTLLPCNHNLEYIWVHNVFFTSEQLQIWIARNSKLRFLKVSGDYDDYIEKRNLRARKIKYLQLDVTRKVLCWNINLLRNAPRTLKHLSVCRIEKSSLESYKNLFENVSLDTLAFGEMCEGLTKETLQLIASTQKQLKILIFNNRQTISKNGLMCIVRNCGGLEKLLLRQTHFKTETLISIIQELKYCKSLTLLNNRKVTDSLLKSIPETCNQVENINLSWCSEISNAGIENIVTNCLNMNVLVLENCCQLTNDTLKVIAIHGKCIKSLNLSFCYKLGDEGISMITENCSNLKELNICYCIRLTDDTLKSIAKDMNFITNLNIAKCYQMTEDGVLQVLEKCVHLRRLHMDFSTNSFQDYPLAENGLTDLTLKNIVRFSTALTYLILGADCMFTGKEIIKVINCCKHLKLLDIRSCYIEWTTESLKTGIDEKYFQSLKWKNPTLKILDDHCYHNCNYEYDNFEDWEDTEWEDYNYCSD